VPDALPIVCSHGAPDLSERLTEFGALGRGELLAARVESTRAVLRLAAGAGVRDRVVALAEAESRCCAFLTLRVSDEPDEVVLAIDAPAVAQLVLEELVDAFRAGPEAV